MPSEWLIQVVHAKTGEVCHSWLPGLAVERQFIEEIVNRTVSKGVGMWRTSAHVAEDVRSAVKELLYDLKSQV